MFISVWILTMPWWTCLQYLQTSVCVPLQLDPLIVGLSDSYEFLHALRTDAASAAAKVNGSVWVPPTSFQRVTRKFWLRMEDVMRFKVTVIKHLPVLIFGEREKLMSGANAAVSGKTVVSCF